MNEVSPHLSLEGFLFEMSRGPLGSLTHERLMDLTHRLNLSDELIETRACFAANTYARNLVCRSADFELLVLCWKPGHASTIHDHAGSLNAIRVHRGELTSRVFVPAAGRPAGAGPVELLVEEYVRPSGRTSVDRHGVHQLANTAGEDLATVRVSAPPPAELVAYSTDSAETERRPLRHTHVDDLA